MAPRKTIPKNRKDSREQLRFTPAEIVRTIEAVQAAGLPVYSVEITLAGAINISTQPPPGISKRSTPPRQAPLTNSVDEITPDKKLA
jgi:hypothetical protein